MDQLNPGNRVKFGDTVYWFTGEVDEDVDLNGENFTDLSRWVPVKSPFGGEQPAQTLAYIVDATIDVAGDLSDPHGTHRILEPGETITLIVPEARAFGALLSVSGLAFLFWACGALSAAVAFATILAVVAGLTLAGASAISHDLYVGAIRRGVSAEKEEVRVAKIATICLGVAAILLGILFKGQNVAFMVGLAFAVAASANFPALLLSILWKNFTTAGAVASIITGLVLAVVLIVVAPTRRMTRLTSHRR